VQAPEPEDDRWYVLPPETLPQPTYWPAVMALGIVFILWGVAATLMISGVGMALFALALAGWIGELRHAQRSPVRHRVD
jgi:hypothetical protein